MSNIISTSTSQYIDCVKIHYSFINQLNPISNRNRISCDNTYNSQTISNVDTNSDHCVSGTQYKHRPDKDMGNINNYNIVQQSTYNDKQNTYQRRKSQITLSAMDNIPVNVDQNILTDDHCKKNDDVKYWLNDNDIKIISKPKKSSVWELEDLQNVQHLQTVCPLTKQSKDSLIIDGQLYINSCKHWYNRTAVIESIKYKVSKINKYKIDGHAITNCIDLTDDKVKLKKVNVFKKSKKQTKSVVKGNIHLRFTQCPVENCYAQLSKDIILQCIF